MLFQCSDWAFTLQLLAEAWKLTLPCRALSFLEPHCSSIGLRHLWGLQTETIEGNS